MAIHRNQVGAIKTTSQFFADVMQGLRATPKYLQSKYFYDAEGDKLFQQIMRCPEYYLTKCELEIFFTKSKQLAELLINKYESFDVVELGAGDATKSIYLLRQLQNLHASYTYYPIDISYSVINYLENKLPQQVEGISIQGLNGEYVEMLKEANKRSSKRKVVMFLGSNIGNFSTAKATAFLEELNAEMNSGDLLLIGFDLKKNPKQILAAYNDAAGITKAFNLNLLKRMNKELGADFNLQNFEHYPTYDPITGSCKSYLISLKNQTVTFSDTEEIQFEKNEPIYMELSQKYSIKETDAMAQATNFKPIAHFFDSNTWFVDAVWQKL